MKILRKIALILFVLAVLVAGWAYFYYETGDFSEADFRLEIRSEEELETGSVTEYTVVYRNNSDIRLEDVRVTFEFPEAAIPAGDGETAPEDGFRTTRELPDLNPGEEETLDFEALVLGQEGESMEAKAWFEYRPQNLTATYEAERTTSGQVKETPIDFWFHEMPEEVEAGEKINFNIRYFSDLESNLENLSIEVEYPDGFELSWSDPAGLDDDLWEKDKFPKREGKRISVEGELEGEPGDIKGFKGELGVWHGDRFFPLKTTESRVLIPQSDLYVEALVNNEVDYVADPGEELVYDIFVRNLGDEILEDLFLEVELDEKFMDFDSLEPMEGNFHESAGKIMWSPSLVNRLSRLHPEDEESVSFWSKVEEGGFPYNPEMRVGLSLPQTRKKISTKINTKFELSKNFKPEEDPFESEGPVPVEVDRPSNVTMKWEIGNLYNDVEDFELNAILSEEVGIVEVENERGEFDFDSRTGEIVWTMEEIKKGAGADYQGPEVYIQLEILPASSPEEDFEMITDLEMKAVDNWTGEEVKTEKEPLQYIDLLEDFDEQSESSPEEAETNQDNQDE